MVKVNEEVVYTLQEIEKKLEIEQHKLIHLCEKGVIVPDIGNSSGRGTMRKFSERNLFEFALALELRKFQLPLNYIAPIIRILELFEKFAAREIDVFSLPESLQQKAAVKLKILIGDGDHLVFILTSAKTNVYLKGFHLQSFVEDKKESLSGLKKTSEDPRSSFTSFIEIDLNQIANKLL